MKSRTIKILSVLIAVMVLFSLTAGCVQKSDSKVDTGSGDKEASTGEETAKVDSGKEESDSEIKLPIVDEPLELEIFSKSNSAFKKDSYGEKACVKKMEELTNIKLKWTMAPLTNHKEQFNLIMNSGQIPDLVVYYMDKNANTYGSRGIFLSVESYIDKYMPNFKRILNEQPMVRKLITSSDGKIYQFPNIRSGQNSVKMFPQIRADWLEKLDLKEPVTTDDWYNVLKAFRTKDPNGNGEQDEIPFATVLDDRFLAEMFAPAFGVQRNFYVDNGKVKYGPYEENYKEVLTYLNRLYTEKLLDNDYVMVTKFPQFIEKVTTEKAGAWFGWGISYFKRFTQLMEEANHPTFELIGTVPPKGPRGDQLYTHISWPVISIGMAVSAKTENVEAVMKWIDFQYSEMGTMLNNFGIEGESYDMVDGYPEFKDMVVNPPEGKSGQEVLKEYAFAGEWPMIFDARAVEQLQLPAVAEAMNKVSQYIDMSKMCPSLQFSAADESVRKPIMTDVDAFTKEKLNAFIMGEIPLSDFDSFRDELKKMQIEKVLEIYQKEYDRFMND